MNWIPLTSLEELEKAVEQSTQEPMAIFKHSTRCSVSFMAKKNLELEWDIEDTKVYYLDLLSYRDVSNAIADNYDVVHQSPQLIGFNKGEVFYHASHSSISAESFKSALNIVQ